jgi:serine/threonine protein phosphatase PrpC
MNIVNRLFGTPVKASEEPTEADSGGTETPPSTTSEATAPSTSPETVMSAMDILRGWFKKLFEPSDKPAATSGGTKATPPEATPAAPTTAPEAAPVQASKPAAAGQGISDGVTRPLPPETVISTQNEHIKFGQSTDVGMVRSNNQDSALSLFFASRSAEQRPDFGLFMVADGMGGHHDGEKASAMTTRVVASELTSNVYVPLLNKQENTDHVAITETMAAAVQKANMQVIAAVPEAGTTLSAVMIIENQAFVAHVGDSRIYNISKEGIEQITRDHSLVQRMIELDQLTPQEAAEHPQKNVLYRAIGQSESLEIDTSTLRLPPHSHVLLCSDGLWGQVEDSKIHEIVNSHPNPQEACDKLVALANTQGGIDNITAILLKVPGN